MHKYLLLLTFYLTTFFVFSQNDSIKRKDTINKSPILYGDISYGISREFNDGLKLMLGASFTYQHKNNIFSLRYVENNEIKTVFLLFPTVVNKSKEYAFLYGKRWIEHDMSYNFSAGISTSNYSVYERDEIISSEDYLGVPFEINIKWFKPEKQRFGLLYGIIPIGNPTAFGRSYGFKIVGNLSKRSYIGIGVVFGLGVHKHYD